MPCGPPHAAAAAEPREIRHMSRFSNGRSVPAILNRRHGRRAWRRKRLSLFASRAEKPRRRGGDARAASGTARDTGTAGADKLSTDRRLEAAMGAAAAPINFNPFAPAD